mgnify:FL=1
MAGGKTLVLDLECQEGSPVGLRISGDFFFHPEEGLERLESFLVESKAWDLDGAEDRIAKFMQENGFRSVGFAPSDLAYLVRGLRC